MFVEYCFCMKMQIAEIHKACQSSDMQVIFREQSFPFSDKEELLVTLEQHRIPFPSITAANFVSPFHMGCNSRDKKAGIQVSELSTIARPVAWNADYIKWTICNSLVTVSLQVACT